MSDFLSDYTSGGKAGSNTSSGTGPAPKRRHRIAFNAPVILAFTALSFAAMLSNYLTGGIANRLLFITRHGSMLNPLTWLRMFTYVLGHSSFEHWLSNFLIILIVGPMIEEKYGSRRTLVLILVTTFATAAVNNLLFHTGLIGASGVAFALILLSSFASYQEGTVPATLILVAVLYIGREVVNGLTADSISQFAHIVGGFIGCAAGFALNQAKAHDAK
ncbi:rhomboid family intramembrane serine protease [Paratractidigestivibacter sp.]|uniref:rhomboid family intramembrane serine protease n=1 Tax=Paratractidigestivibacter sp. TaxID=2847316 RepID=UPI002AC9B89C|nr:rhomboid family intramembrane serine protease [Paratractidigestivibacter sp.]